MVRIVKVNTCESTTDSQYYIDVSDCFSFIRTGNGSMICMRTPEAFLGENKETVRPIIGHLAINPPENESCWRKEQKANPNVPWVFWHNYSYSTSVHPSHCHSLDHRLFDHPTHDPHQSLLQSEWRHSPLITKRWPWRDHSGSEGPILSFLVGPP